MECKCNMRQKLVGDGCEACNPAKALEYAKQTIADLEAEVDRLRKVALQHVPHAYKGMCPDSVTGMESRDPHCPACQILE